LQQRLSSLQVVLYELVRQAKMRSGVEVKPKSESPSTSTTTESKTKSSSSKKDTPDKPKTAAEKRDDAKRQKEYREKQQREHPKPAQQVENLHKQIADTKDRIQKMRKTLASARNRSGPKVESAGSVGASLPKTK
jgi:molecular chaperone GrpE (heat shock protein)